MAWISCCVLGGRLVGKQWLLGRNLACSPLTLICTGWCGAGLQVFKGGRSRTGMEEGEQFRYFAQQVGGATVMACRTGTAGL